MTPKPAKTQSKVVVKPKTLAKERYYEARGARKTATALARLTSKKSEIVVNGKSYKEYFKIPSHQEAVIAPFKMLNQENVGASVKVYGGGIHAQAEAVRHAISRALVKMDEALKKRLRQFGFLTRDPRMVERKKYGLKKARRAPQWAKR